MGLNRSDHHLFARRKHVLQLGHRKHGLQLWLPFASVGVYGLHGCRSSHLLLWVRDLERNFWSHRLGLIGKWMHRDWSNKRYFRRSFQNSPRGRCFIYRLLLIRDRLKQCRHNLSSVSTRVTVLLWMCFKQWSLKDYMFIRRVVWTRNQFKRCRPNLFVFIRRKVSTRILFE